MKVVINSCFGGFGLSRKAVKRLAELQGRECYFFTHEISEGRLQIGKYAPAKPEEPGKRDLFCFAFDIPNPNEVLPSNDEWHSLSFSQKQAHDEVWDKHHLNSRPDDRTDPLLIQVVEELGEEANGPCAQLKIVEIPDGIEWEIDEYDGSERIDEVHRTWS